MTRKPKHKSSIQLYKDALWRKAVDASSKDEAPKEKKSPPTKKSLTPEQVAASNRAYKAYRRKGTTRDKEKILAAMGYPSMSRLPKRKPRKRKEAAKETTTSSSPLTP